MVVPEREAQGHSTRCYKYHPLPKDVSNFIHKTEQNGQQITNICKKTSINANKQIIWNNSMNSVISVPYTEVYYHQASSCFLASTLLLHLG